MERYYALIKNHIIESVVVANDDFLSHIKDKYDYIIDVTDNRPNIGDSYYPATEEFISNTEKNHIIDVDTNLEHLQLGEDDGFAPFTLSKYSVKYNKGLVTIGCKQYNAAGLLDALHRGLEEHERGTVSCFMTHDDGPSHGKFGITWDDAHKLYEALRKVKLT